MVNNLKDYTLNLQAGVQQKITTNGSYYHVLRAPSSVKLAFNDGAEITRNAGQGGSYSYDYVAVYSDTNQTVTLALGHGQYFESTAYAFTGLTPPNDSIEYPDVTLTASSTTQVLLPNENRFVAYLFSPQNNQNPIRVHFNNPSTTNSGGIIYPGGNAELRTKTGIWVTALNTDAELYILESQNV